MSSGRLHQLIHLNLYVIMYSWRDVQRVSFKTLIVELHLFRRRVITSERLFYDHGLMK